MAVTAVLQSSTATAILTTSFAKKGAVTLAAAMAIMIGADVSTTLVAQVLALDLSWLSPILLIIGVVIYLSNERKGLRRHAGRIFIGLGLMLLSLSLIREAATPLKESELLPLIITPLIIDPVFAIILATIITWTLHSSLASVLLFSSLASGGIINLQLGLLLVLGANIGGALVPLAVTFKEGVKAHQITISNLMMRMCVAILVMIFFYEKLAHLQNLPGDTAHQIIHAHTIFNIVLAFVFLPFITPMAALFEKLLKEEKARKNKNNPQYLDESALETPALALAGAARETLRIAELIEKMLANSIEAFETNDKDVIKKIRASDNQIDHLYKAIKFYLTRLSQESFDLKEADRYMQILTFSTNLEHIGDIIDKSLMGLAEKRIRKQEKFSKAGFKEIKEFHGKVLENIGLAQAIFMSSDQGLAAQLVEGKSKIRKAAENTSIQHFKRLQERQSESLATSSLHLDIIRDYRRINSYITRVAYATLRSEEDSAQMLE